MQPSRSFAAQALQVRVRAAYTRALRTSTSKRACSPLYNEREAESCDSAPIVRQGATWPA